MAAVRESKHQIYTGTFEALEIGWKETIVGLQMNDPLAEVSVLAGSNILAAYLRRRLTEDGRPAANIRFYNFPDLVRHILTRAPVLSMEKPKLPSFGAAVLLESLLENRASLPKAYAPLADSKGFRDALLETFHDLRDADITPGDLDNVIAAGRRAADRREQLESFADMYRRYRKEVCRFRDTDDDFRDAIEKLSRSTEAVDFAPLLVYGVYDATGQQAQFLDALGRTRRMIYFIPFVDAAVSEFARPFLDARAANLGVEPKQLVLPAKTDSLGQLAERNFGFSREPVCGGELEADGSFALVSAPGESRAAVEVAREILRAARDGVISSFNEAAVILRQPENDIPILSEALRLRKIPYYIHGGEKFSSRPICKAVLAISGLEAADFHRNAILSAVEFIGAALRSETGPEKWDVENWRDLTRESEALTGVRAWDAATRGVLRRAAGAIPRYEQTPETAANELATARERLDAARRLRQSWRKLRAAATDWPVRASFAEWSKELRRRFGKILKTSLDWPYMLSALDEIAELETFAHGLAQSRGRNAKYEVSAAKIRTLLEEAVQSPAYPAGRFQQSGVNILGVSAARGLRFPLVVIPGLDEGRFPSALRQDPLLPDAERRRLGSLSLRGARAGEEKLLFDMAARSAARRLVLVTSRLDESADREKFPSLFFLRTASAASGGRIAPGGFDAGNIPGFRSVSLDAAAPADGIAAVDEGEVRLRWITSGGLPSARALMELALLEPRRLRLPLEYERSRSEDRLTKFDGLISDPRLLQWTRQKLNQGSGQMSASRFENYARCPYSFFLKHILELRIPEDERGMTESMDPSERGTAVHAALESFLKNHLSKSFVFIPEKWFLASLEEEARRELEKKRPVGIPVLLWEIERDGLIDLLRNWLEFETARAGEGMRIARLEQAFGNPSEFPAFRPDVDKSNFEFCGRIDRVDISADGKRARVIDYKTGKLPDTLKKKDRPLLMGGEKIQLVVYRGALTALDEFAAVEAVEAEYLYLQPKDGDVRKSALTPEQVDAAFADLPRVLRILDSSMKNGLFFARTYSAVYPNGQCDYCDFLPVCGKDRVWRENRKIGDPAIQEFMAISKTLL
jgi:RecB family exonuclease